MLLQREDRPWWVWLRAYDINPWCRQRAKQSSYNRKSFTLIALILFTIRYPPLLTLLFRILRNSSYRSWHRHNIIGGYNRAVGYSGNNGDAGNAGNPGTQCYFADGSRMMLVLSFGTSKFSQKIPSNHYQEQKSQDHF
jgi:hypothetical protein